MTTTIPTKAERENTKRVDQLERGDWIHADFEDFYDVARVVHVETYPSDSWGVGAVLLYRAAGETDVHTKRFAASDSVRMLTDDEIGKALEGERREAIARQFYDLAQLIRNRKVPLPASRIMVDWSFGEDVASVEAMAELTGEKTVSYGRTVSVLKETSEDFGPSIVVDWSARHAEPKPATRLTPAPIAKHYDATDPDAGEESCACGEVFATRELLKQHIAAGNAETEPPVDLTAAVAADPPAMAASGLTLAADQSRGVLAGTTPVVTYFSFGHGQRDPGTGKKLIDHYVTVVAPTYEECRTAMFASRFGRAWAFDYLAGSAKATEWVSRWTEHEVIVAPGVDPGDADRALAAAMNVLGGE